MTQDTGGHGATEHGSMPAAAPTATNRCTKWRRQSGQACISYTWMRSVAAWTCDKEADAAIDCTGLLRERASVQTGRPGQRARNDDLGGDGVGEDVEDGGEIDAAAAAKRAAGGDQRYTSGNTAGHGPEPIRAVL